jgi:hypothetical protein
MFLFACLGVWRLGMKILLLQEMLAIMGPP